jgi:hypothetical protein
LPLSQLPVAIERAMAKERCRMVVRPDSPDTGYAATPYEAREF